MSTQLPDLTARIRIDTSGLDRGLAQAQGGLKRFGGIAAGALAGLSLASAVKQVASIGIAYQDSLNIFRSVSGANAAQMAEVGKAAKALGNDLSLPNTSAAGAATALTELAKAGLSVKDALAAGKGTLQLATAGALSEGEAATVAANALNTFGLAGSQAARVANVLANAANVSSGEVSDFAQGLAQGGLVAKQAGLSIEETAGALALFANNGLKGSDAGTSLKTALLRLQAPTKDVQALMAGLGINVRDSQGAMLPLAGIAQVLKDRLGGLSDAQRAQAMSAIFGSDAIRAGTLLFDAGRVGVDKYTTAVGRAGGAADVAAARSKGLGGAIKGLRSTLETLSLTAFEKVAPALERGLRGFTVALPQVLAGVGGAISAALSAPIVAGIITPLKAALGQAKALVLDFFGVKPTLPPIKVPTKLDRIAAGGDGRPIPVVPTLGARKAAAADASERTPAPEIKPGSAVIDPTFSQRIAEGIAQAVERIDPNTIGPKLGTLVAKALTAAGSAAAQITVAIGSMLEKVDFPGLAVQLGKKAPAVLLGFALGLLNLDLGPIFSVLKDHLLEAFIGVFALFTLGASTGASALIRAVLTKLPFGEALLVPLAKGVRGAARFLVNGAADLLGAFAGGMFGGIARVFPSIGGRFATEMGLVGTRLGLAGLKIAEIAKAIPGKIGEAILRGVGFVGGAVGELIGRLLRPFSGLAGRFFQFGGEIIGGLVGGIIRGAGRVISALKEYVIDKLPKFVQKALGIASPSRVFAKLGEQIPAGLAVGIRSGLGPVRTAIGDMTDLAGIRFGGPGFVQQRVAQADASAASSGLTINGGITINSGGAPSEESLTRSLRNMAWTMGV